MKTVQHDKFVPAKKRAEQPQPSPHGAVHCVWRRCRGGLFSQPERICLHEEDASTGLGGWEVYDIDAAGCTSCGGMHRCRQEGDGCTNVENEEGQLICSVTGLCTRMLVFAATEFTDNNNCRPEDEPLPCDSSRSRRKSAAGVLEEEESRRRLAPPPPSLPTPALVHHQQHGQPGSSSRVAPPPFFQHSLRVGQGKVKMSPSFIRKKKRFSMTTQGLLPTGVPGAGPGLSKQAPGHLAHFTPSSSARCGDPRATVAVCINEIICSPTWERSMLAENGRLDSRIKAAVSKELRRYKTSPESQRLLPVVPNVLATLLNSLGKSRIPLSMSLAGRRKVAHRCTEVIANHISMLHRVHMSAVVDFKMKQYITGLLYLMRQGVRTRGVCILPRIPVLDRILPQESHLTSMFSIRNKCITETENIVKDIIKNSGDLLVQAHMELAAACSGP